MVLEIVHYGNETLRKKGVPISEFNPDLKRLFEDMVETMHQASGIGLAAQQIGKALQFCVVDLRGMEVDFQYSLDGTQPPLELFMPMGLCNPSVEIMDGEKTTYEEGCLSFPSILGDVDRPDWIKCSFKDIEGNDHTLECNGLLGRCIQHEVDHLNGVLYIDRMKKKVLKKIQPEIDQLRAETLESKAN